MAMSLSLPSARPYAFKFPLKTTALLIIDVQRDFVDPGGFGAVQCGNDDIFSKARSIVPATARVLERFRTLGAPVIHTREGHRADLTDLPASKKQRQLSAPNGHHGMGIGDQGPMGRLLVRGEYGHDIVDELAPWPAEVVVDKPGKGSFFGTNIHRTLLAQGITHIIFAGVTTECCVTTTLRECNDRGYECCVLSDCTTGFDAQQVTTSLDIVCGQDGLFGFVATSNEFLAATDTLLTQDTPPATPPVLDALPPIDELINLYKRGAVTPSDVARLVSDLTDRYEQRDPAVWIARQSREQCLQAAAALEAKYAGKPLPALYGVPFSVKDTIDVQGVQTTAACPPYAYMPEAHAPAVQHVLEAGGLFIGKVNLDQLATGLSGCRSPFGVPRSVFSAEHISGGSSSGSAVSVGAGLVSFGLATDTAGSGRVPASFNGIVGFKPTKGTVSAKGLVPACKTLDTITVVAPTVPEARKIWQIIAKHDSSDPYAKPPHTLPTWHIDFRGPRLGGFTFAVPPNSSLQVCTPSYQNLFSHAVQQLRSAGGRLVEVDYSIFEEAGELLYNASLLHERMTCLGLNFLKTNIENDSLHPVINELFSRALASPPSAYDVFADQNKQTVLTRKAQQVFDTLSGGIDVLVVPTTTRHPTVEEMNADPLALNSELGTFTHYANVVDMCGINVQAGTYQTEAGVTLPFGITVLGGSGYDAKVFDIASVFEETRRTAAAQKA
jgi:allophanate hydrolase